MRLLVREVAFEISEKFLKFQRMLMWYPCWYCDCVLKQRHSRKEKCLAAFVYITFGQSKRPRTLGANSPCTEGRGSKRYPLMRTWLTSADFGSEAAVLMFIGCSSGPPGHPTTGVRFSTPRFVHCPSDRSHGSASQHSLLFERFLPCVHCE